MDKRFTLLDGAMGTFLAARLGPGANEQQAVLENPQVLTDIHGDYVNSGTDLVYTATFSSNRYKAKLPIGETIPLAVKAARASGAKTVAMDIGPTGKLVGKYADISCADAYDAFREAISWGGDADAIVIETMFDLAEMRCAILAARENASLPVLATMSFAQGGRSLTGCTPACFALTADSLGVQALGLNCSLGPREMLPYLKEAGAHTALPLIFKPNAGMPDLQGQYQVGAKEFAVLSAEAVQYGAALLGGCCGTAPTYIAALRQALSDPEPLMRKAVNTGTLICSKSRIADITCCEARSLLDDRDIADCLKSGDFAAMAEAAADLAGDCLVFDIDCLASPVQVADAVEELASLVQIPLIIKSEDSSMMEAALRIYCGRAGCLTAGCKAIAEKYGAVIC